MLLPFPEVVEFFRLLESLMRFVQAPAGGGTKPGRKGKPYEDLPIQQRFEIHQRFATDPAGHVERYLKSNPDRLPPADLAEISAWRNAIGGRLIFFRQLKKHLIVMEPKVDTRVFGVLGLTQTIEEMLHGNLPALAECVLFPFRGAIVCDGLLGAFPVTIGPGIRASLNASYQAAKRNGTVVTTFGVPVPPRSKPTSRPTRRKVIDPLARLVSELKNKLAAFRAERAALRRFEDEVMPSFEGWLEATFPKERAEIRRLEEEIAELEELLEEFDFGSLPEGCSTSSEAIDALSALQAGRRESGNAAADADPEPSPRELPPNEFLREVFAEFLWQTRGLDVDLMGEAEAERAFEEFRESFRHAAEGNRPALERSLLGVGADRSEAHVAAVNQAYRRIAKRLHPDKDTEHDEISKELWESLRTAKDALDLAMIERIELEWRLLRGDAFVKNEEGRLKELRAGLRDDLRAMKQLRECYLDHPMWGLESITPPKSLEKRIREEMKAHLRDLRREKRQVESCLEDYRDTEPDPADVAIFLTPPSTSSPSKKTTRKPEQAGDHPDQMRFDF